MGCVDVAPVCLATPSAQLLNGCLEAPASAAEVALLILKLCTKPMGVITCLLELLTEMLEEPESGEWTTIAKAK